MQTSEKSQDKFLLKSTHQSFSRTRRYADKIHYVHQDQNQNEHTSNHNQPPWEVVRAFILTDGPEFAMRVKAHCGGANRHAQRYDPIYQHARCRLSGRRDGEDAASLPRIGDDRQVQSAL